MAGRPKEPKRVAAMVYASKAGGPRLYIGALAVDPEQSADEIRDSIAESPLGGWFDVLDVVVGNPQA